MRKKQFKTESQKLLDMMINSIYTHKEIFLRELISNASDAIDKRYFRALTDSALGADGYEIRLTVDKDARTLTVSDNGCGMTAEEMENNLGTIAKSGSFDFKREHDKQEDVDIIGQFGVGFYSAFMVADSITVTSRALGADGAVVWQSSGVDGYTVGEGERDTVGTDIVLHIKADGEEESYGEFLEEYRLRSLVKKYSDYIRHPIRMLVSRSRLKEGSDKDYETVTEDETLNSMVPLWKRTASEVSAEEYDRFYTEHFMDYEKPLKVITQSSEGTATFTALMFLPSHAPFNYYTKDYEKGLALYSSGVMIMERCAELLPDYFGFVKGLVDSSDLSLNISRETLQHDRQLKIMAKVIEKKIKSELLKLLKSDREAYETFFRAFGLQLKYGLYSDYGMHKDTLADLILFPSSKEEKLVTLDEYIEGCREEQTVIYYAAGESVERIKLLPQVDAVRARGFEVLYLTDDVDEFALRMLGTYKEKTFKNVTDDALDLSDEEEKRAIEEENREAEALLATMKDALGDKVSAVRFTASLKSYPACLSSEGEVSAEMEKVLNRMPGAEGAAVKAKMVLGINREHPIAKTLKDLVGTDDDKLRSYAKLLYAQARLIGGMSVEDPAELSELITALMV